MPHIPPIRFAVVAGNGPNPFTIEGEENEITIELKTSQDVQAPLNLQLSPGGEGFTVIQPAANEPPSKIARIQLVGVQQVSNLVFKPTTNGRCKIKISFEH